MIRLSKTVILFLASSRTVTSELIEGASSAKERSVILFPLKYIFSIILAFLRPAARAMMYLSPKL